MRNTHTSKKQASVTHMLLEEFFGIFSNSINKILLDTQVS